MEPENRDSHGHRNNKTQNKKMKTLKTLTIAIAVSGLVSVTNLQASLAIDGDQFLAQSWGQRFRESDAGNFNRLEVFKVSGSDIEAPGFFNFSSGAWSTSGNAGSAQATGPTLTDVEFDIKWQDPKVTTVIDFYAWDGVTLRDSARGTWDAQTVVKYGWSFVNIPDGSLHTTPVPEPTTMIAGALLLLPFGASMLRTLRKNRAA